MEISSDIVRLIHKVGFYAAEEGDLAYAIRIFEGMRAVRPDSVYPHIGFAITLMLTGRGEEAFAMLNKIKDDHPDEKDEIGAMMGFSLKFSNQDDAADKVFQALLKESQSGEWKDVAKTFLEER